MARAITLFTGQWADVSLDTLARKASAWGYDGLELACGSDHFEVDKALSDDNYCQSRLDILEKYGLKCFALSNRPAGQCVCDDPIDERHEGILPPRIWGDGDPAAVRQRAAEEMQNTARAAARLGVKVVNGFSGSSIWGKVVLFPPSDEATIEAGFQDFADRWNPILDVFDEVEVKFALELHLTEIAYDFYSAERALEAIGHRQAFGFNFNPGHLHWQFVDPATFIERFGDHIYHVQVKDAIRQLDGRRGLLSPHLAFGNWRRGWDFVSPGRGGVDFEAIARALTRAGYQGPFSVEWEDSGMDREYGAKEAVDFVRRVMAFEPSRAAHDTAPAQEDEE